MLKQTAGELIQRKVGGSDKRANIFFNSLGRESAKFFSTALLLPTKSFWFRVLRAAIPTGQAPGEALHLGVKIPHRCHLGNLQKVFIRTAGVVVRCSGFS